MGKRDFRYLPIEQGHGAWPLLAVLPEDRGFVYKPETSAQRRRRYLCTAIQKGWDKLLLTLPKGAFLGLICFVIFTGIYLQQHFWLQNWHWVMLIAGLLVFTVLVGFDITLLLFTALALWFSKDSIMSQPWLIVLFLLGGILIRYLLELLYRYLKQ